MANPIPLTIQTSNESNLSARIAVGSNLLTLDRSLSNTYWVLVLDRTDASVKENFHTTDNKSVPAQLKPYLGNTQYILVVATQYLGTAYLPTGAWHDYLVSEGAGVQLLRLERIYEAFNCGTWGWMSYAYVAIMGDETTNGFEASNVQNAAAFLALDLVPISFGSQTLYTPASLTASSHS